MDSRNFKLIGVTAVCDVLYVQTISVVVQAGAGEPHHAWPDVSRENRPNFYWITHNVSWPRGSFFFFCGKYCFLCILGKPPQGLAEEFEEAKNRFMVMNHRNIRTPGPMKTEYEDWQEVRYEPISLHLQPNYLKLKFQM